NKGSKFIEVREIERTKTNVPVNIRNCFQIHKLSYSEQGNEQSLEGTWVPVPNQEGDCGYGSTMLSRRILQKNPNYYNDNTTKTKPEVKSKPQPNTAPVIKNTTPKPAPVVKTQPKKPVPPPVAKAETKKPTQPVVKSIPETAEVKAEVLKNVPPPATVKVEPVEKKAPEPRFEKRNSDLIKTIEIDNPTFTVDLYDNGEIDGDSVSLFYNGKLLISHKRLSDKALRLKLDVDAGKDINELIMYAENLGTIPPNTALMVVNDGDNRYEVRISSDLQKSGVIRFIHRPKPGQ
ncbi:MAG TPA: hypothetical protein VHL77_01130, partial [Ferruginibacter sp.]|nr:hypothetical protein [Ferruginibacter sp.]